MLEVGDSQLDECVVIHAILALEGLDVLGVAVKSG